ncbi:thioredoxin [candidate division KSB1 bacterium]|nr:thioredoxin [candidate division KSB1 bacterium]
MSNLLEITDDNFEQHVIKSDLPVLIDFWAVWCAPCKMVAPIIEGIANDYAGKIKVGQCDVDKSRQVAMQYGIRSIPTILLFKNGDVVESIVGAAPKAHIVGKISKHI